MGEPSIKLDHVFDAALRDLLAPFKRAVLAVSGGPDSMAMMVLAARWVSAGRAPEGLSIEVATVDHRLRPESAREAEWVAHQARALGFPHATLVWSGDKPQSSVQELAREARYALLVSHARSHAPAAVITAHTADDQAETFLMRLARGSGVDGLASMAKSRPLLPDGSVALLRPLLGIPKVELLSVVQDAGVPWLDDPSNDRIVFERVRLRRGQETMAALGLTNEKITLSATRVARARSALASISEARLTALVDVHGGVFASFLRASWSEEPQEIRLRILARLLEAFGGEANPARLSQVEALESALSDGDRPLAQTLGGCIVSKGRSSIRLYREPRGVQSQDVVLKPGHEMLWDWRFRLRYNADSSGGAQPVVVRPLGLAAYATLKTGTALNQRPPARAIAGLPSIWRGDSLVAVPPLGEGVAAPDFTAEFVGLERRF